MELRKYDNVDEFYANAMISIQKQLGNKLKMLGVEVGDIPNLIESNELCRYTSQIVDGIVLERYEYKGINLIEVEWSMEGIKQRDINKDERDFREDSEWYQSR